jgi:hypothetical protein
MKERKFDRYKGLIAWIALGIVVCFALVYGFAVLSNLNIRKVNIDLLAESSDEISFDGNTLTTTGNAPKLFFNSTEKQAVNYIDISVSNMSEPNVNARLYYYDSSTGFNWSQADSFYLHNGFNEIKVSVDTSEYMRLDIADKEGVSLTLDAITLRSAQAPALRIPCQILLFAVFWLALYAVAKQLGVKFTSITDSSVTLLEGMLALLLSLIIVYSVCMVRYRFMVYLLTPFAVCVLAKIYARLNTDKVKLKLLVPFVLAVMTGIMCVVGYKMVSHIYTDLAAVYESAWEIAANGRVNTICTGNEPYTEFFKASNNDYFVRYPNNIPLLAILAVLYKVLYAFGLGAKDFLSNYISVLFNIVFIMAGVLFGVLTAKNLFGKKGAVVYLVLSLLFVPYYINACRFYTDTISMPFVTLALWIYSIDDKRFKSPYIKYALMGAAICAGALIKGSIMVMVVALLMQLALKGIKNIRFAVVTILVVVLMNGAWSTYTKNCSWIDLSDSNSLEFPLTHWVMMGINKAEGGGYSQSDFEYTDKYSTKETKKKADIRVIKQRLANFSSLSELGDYELSKAAATWCDGQYMQDNHIEWGKQKGAVYDWLIDGREYNSLYRIYTQIFAYCIYIFAIAGALFGMKKSKADYAMFLRLTMLGVIFFFMLWESKSRYIFNFTPMFMLAAIYGLEEIKKRFFDKEN